MDTFKDEREWLASLKVGELVLVSYRWNKDHVDLVQHVTANYITVNKARYNRRTGFGCGDSRASLLRPTPARLEAIEVRDLRRRLDGAKWQSASVEMLRAVVAIIDAKEPKP